MNSSLAPRVSSKGTAMDKISVEDRSRNMSRIRSKDTGPELAVRKIVLGLGYGYRLRGIRLPGNPDLIFPGRRKAIFVHGCFWHQHKVNACSLVHTPKSRVDYWQEKLDRNRQRDCENQSKLSSLGWDFLVIWECQLGCIVEVSERIREFLEGSSR